MYRLRKALKALSWASWRSWMNLDLEDSPLFFLVIESRSGLLMRKTATECCEWNARYH